MKWGKVALAAAAIAVAAGCTDDVGELGGPCNDRQMCLPGLTCKEGICVASGAADAGLAPRDAGLADARDSAASTDAGDMDAGPAEAGPADGAAAVIELFQASPPVVDLGQSSVLSWRVHDAPGGVEIAARGATATVSGALEGSFAVTPTTTTDYALVAKNPAGNATHTASVTVRPGVPVITRFEADPNPAPLGGDALLRWATLGATGLRVLRATPRPAELVTPAGGAGSMQVTLTSTLTVFSLEAHNEHGDSSARLEARAEAPPVIDAFDVEPLAFLGASVTATVRWSTTHTTRAALAVDGVPDPAFPNLAAGRYHRRVSGTATFELIARSAGGEARESRQVVQVLAEVEPNDTSSTALRLSAAGGDVDGSIDPAGDVDFYAIDVPASGNVYAETSDGSGGCGLDTTLRLYGPDGTTQLGSDDDDGPGVGLGTCSEIDPIRDAWAANLSAGTHFVAVEAFAGVTVGDYVLEVRAQGPECGNGVLEPAAGEQCDDENQTSGDGCSASCRFEIAHVITPPGASITASLPDPGSYLIYRIDTTIPGQSITATAADASGACTLPTRLDLLDESGALLGTDDSDGPDGCAAFHVPRDAFVTDLPTGSYYLVLSKRSTAAATTQLDVSIIDPACGNGIIETQAGETCDDANTTSSEGCNSTCDLEPGWVCRGVPSGCLRAWVELAAGVWHNCGIKSDGSVECWGSNNFGESTAPAGTFSRVDGSCVAHHMCGVRTDGTATCWGKNDNGQATVPAGTFTQFAMDATSTCGLRDDQTVHCWGYSVSSIAGTFLQIATARRQTCGVRTD